MPDKVFLDLSGVYYRNAVESYEECQAADKKVSGIKREIYIRDEEINEFDERWESGEIDEGDHYDHVEPLAIQLDSLYGELDIESYALIKSAVSVHINCCLCLESFANIVAKDLLDSDFVYKQVEKMSVEAKFIMLLKLLGGQSDFNMAEKEYGWFKKLIKMRNKLVHYKGKEEPWAGYRPPAFLKPLGIDAGHAKRSCEATKYMIKKLCEFTNYKEPEWIEGYLSVFRLKFEDMNPALRSIIESLYK